MKEKTIEKIPYLGLKKISRIKSVKYIGVTAIKNIGHQRHLLLEVYENKKESKKIPVVRITLTKKDFGTYWPDKQIWTRQQLSAYSPIWTETHTYTAKSLADENILQSPEDLARIKSFCGTEIYNDTRWWGHIAEYEGDITSKERTKSVEWTETPLPDCNQVVKKNAARCIQLHKVRHGLRQVDELSL